MNLKYLLYSYLWLGFSFGPLSKVCATHLRAGEITVERESCNSLTFIITITVFTNTINTNVLFGGEDDWLDFGDGTRMRVPEQQNILKPDLGEGIATASFQFRHTYAGHGSYIISYSEPYRNRGVVNMDASESTRFYIETQIIVDPFLGCNNTPRLHYPPIGNACTAVEWSHNPGALDPDGDSISYELVIPFSEKGTQVINYKDPSDRKFYADYDNGNEGGNSRPTFSIDPNGTIKWDAPGLPGEYNIAFIIREWRFVSGSWFSPGFIRRDMQIIVDDCKNSRPDLIIPKDVCIEAGSTLDEIIHGIDPEHDDVKIEAVSEIFNFAAAQSPATYEPNPAIFKATAPTSAQLKFHWKTECLHIKEQPYQVVFKITDNSPNGRLVTFKTWFIRVVGPEPKWVGAQTDLATRVANLQWESYSCQNAQTLQVWRRVDSFAFAPDSCQTGMPDFLGYSLIASLPVKDANNVPVTIYTDTNEERGLASGAQYCYRLVAIFPQPKGGESYVSGEICIDPILADGPVITNVTVDRTGTSDGQVMVRWTKPFDINRTQFPGPFQYQVYRAVGFTGGNPVNVSGTGRLSEDETTFVDQGMNTLEVVYNYRIVLWSNTSRDLNVYVPIDTSSIASTVRLEAKSEFKKIILNWSALVPWSNIIQTEPNEHLLFRGPEGSTEAMALIASIDPATDGFTYVDEGQHNNEPLVDTEKYCYRVMTRGAYGNPKIGEPLENFSQVICGRPSDNIPPCKPILLVELSDCEKFLQEQACDVASFNNKLTWNRLADDCAEDILGYKIYRADKKDNVFAWLGSAGTDGIVRDTFFIDNGIDGHGLSTLAYCYKIAAVDKSDNESELGEAVCNDNCPYYELPNVFSPNGDNCNDLFSAWSDRPIRGVGEDSDCKPDAEVLRQKCARFVQHVAFRVYNRWGMEVYNYESGGEQTIYIDWNGHATDGSELASGVYFYIADVVFDSIDPEKRNKMIKGWVHILR